MPTRITADLREVKNTLGILQETLERGLRGAVRRWLVGISKESFRRRASPEGQPWAPLSRFWELTPKKRGARAVLDSIYGHIEGKTVEVGSHVPFASAYQEGASYPALTITPRPGHRALRFFSGGPVFGPFQAGGAGAVFGMKFEIPARTLPPRPFLPSPQFAERGAVEIINQQLEDALERAAHA